MKAAAAALMALGLSACATQDPRSNPEAMEPLICSGKDQCDRYWQRAQAWIAQNSAYKIQTQSDSTLQTFGPINARTELAYVVTKVPEADGTARIFIRPACGNIFGCSPDPTQAIIAFKRFVKT